MAHCNYKNLQDLAAELEKIRELPALKEPKPGIFYLKSAGFLHFHEKDGKRWADVRAGKNWGAEVAIPFAASKRQRAEFLAEVARRYALTLKK